MFITDFLPFFIIVGSVVIGGVIWGRWGVIGGILLGCVTGVLWATMGIFQKKGIFSPVVRRALVNDFVQKHQELLKSAFPGTMLQEAEGRFSREVDELFKKARSSSHPLAQSTKLLMPEILRQVQKKKDESTDPAVRELLETFSTFLKETLKGS